MLYMVQPIQLLRLCRSSFQSVDVLRVACCKLWQIRWILGIRSSWDFLVTSHTHYTHSINNQYRLIVRHIVFFRVQVSLLCSYRKVWTAEIHLKFGQRNIMRINLCFGSSSSWVESSFGSFAIDYATPSLIATCVCVHIMWMRTFQQKSNENCSFVRSINCFFIPAAVECKAYRCSRK